jgi:antitoxin CptB
MEENKITSLIENIPRLQWACRRGMLELDVLLGNFLNEAYPQLSVRQKKQFVALLECADPEIYAWLIESASAQANASIAEIIMAIREHARTRIST